jgi:hypothetical protein
VNIALKEYFFTYILFSLLEVYLVSDIVCFQRHCAAVYLVRKLDSNILLQRLKQQGGIRKPEYTIALGEKNF